VFAVIICDANNGMDKNGGIAQSVEQAGKVGL
jgi:hypothetical protein